MAHSAVSTFQCLVANAFLQTQETFAHMHQLGETGKSTNYALIVGPNASILHLPSRSVCTFIQPQSLDLTVHLQSDRHPAYSFLNNLPLSSLKSSLRQHC